jgi:DNA-binding Lrp family transcriptional regulator
MQQALTIDELDLQLVNALQLAPRASWQSIGEALHVDPVTVNRRWRRLVEAGAARVTAHQSQWLNQECCMAHVELACMLGEAANVARTLAEDPNVFTVHLAAGDYNVLLTLAARDVADLSVYLTERVGKLKGVTSARTHIQTSLLIDGSSWEVGALDGRQRAALTTGAARGWRRTPYVPQPIDDEIYRVLAVDGRMTHTELATRLGVSISTARRRLDSLIASRRLVLRCDIARSFMGWSVAAYLHATCHRDIRPLVPQLRDELPELRVFATIASARNLHLFVWLRRVHELENFESRLNARVPDLVVGQRTVLLRTVKQVGHLQDELGRAVRVIPTAV